MYTEEKPRRGGLLKEFIMKLILIIIFVLLLIWLVPWPNMDALNPLKDQIFNANLQTMKEAAIPYFTTERLPQNVGDKTTLTLQKMLDLKLVVPFTDKNGNSCDVKKSYVSLEKQETEYLMKVNLKCGEEEDYILVHLGCYSYCTSDICEAKPGNKEKSTTVVKKVVKDNVNPPTPTPTPKIKKPVLTPTPTPTPEPIPTPTMKPPVINICSVVNGVYYDNSGNVTTQANYNNVCNTIIIVPTPTPTSTPKPTPTPSSEKEWQYLRTVTETKKIEAEYSKWSEWTTYTLKKNQTIPTSTDTFQVEDLGIKRVVIGTKSAVYENVYEEHTEMAKYKTLSYKLCENYSYVADSSTVYKVLTDWAYTGDIKYGYSDSIPADTLDTRWVLVDVQWDVCKETCTSHPYGVWKKMTRKVEKSTTVENISATCTKVVDKSVDVYISMPVGKYYTIEKEKAQTLYGNVHQYRTRSRTLLKEAYVVTSKSTQEKWSFYNDITLISQGYKMTGVTRTKSTSK